MISPPSIAGTSWNSGALHGMFSTVSPFGIATIVCARISGARWLTTGRLNASAMCAAFIHCVIPPARSRSIITMSMLRCSSMCRNGAMP